MDQGMGRTVRHFTGRLDLWTPKLQRAVEDQLRPQLWKIATGTATKSRTRNNTDNNRANDAPTSNKKKNTGDGSTPESITNTTARTSFSSSPIPISIRLVMDQFVIHEDVLWDDDNNLVSPFDFARDMAEEMNLPDEAVVAIATTMIEQIYGLSMDATKDARLPTTATATSGNDKGSGTTAAKSSSSSSAAAGVGNRGAWAMDPKEHASITAQVVSQHRSI